MKKPLLISIVFVLVVVSLAATAWTYFLKKSNETNSVPGGNEMAGLSASEAPPPNEGEIVQVPCKSESKLAAGEWLIGKPGAYIKVLPNGRLTQVTGEELANIRTAFNPIQGDTEILIQMECAEDLEEGAGATTWFLSSVKPEQFFSTKKGVKVRTQLTDDEKTFFVTQINTACVDQGDFPETEKPPCTRPTPVAITDLNENGQREYWFTEPYMWDNGIGVIEEPQNRILTACPGCD